MKNLKTKIITSLLALILICNVSAQDKKVSLQLQKKSYILDVKAIKDVGFVIRTGPIGYIKPGWDKCDFMVYFFDLDLNLIWEKAIEREELIYNPIIITDVSNSTIYHIELLLRNKTYEINQLTLDGNLNKHGLIKKTLESTIKGTLGGVFATKDNLYFLREKYFRDNSSRSKQFDNELFLYELNAADFSRKEIALKLSKPTTPHNQSTFWSYESHDEEGIYFVSVMLDKSTPNMKSKHTIVKMSYLGEILKEIKIDIERNGVVKMGSSREEYISYESYNGYEKQSHEGGLISNNISSDGNTLVKIDNLNKCVYIYIWIGTTFFKCKRK